MFVRSKVRRSAGFNFSCARAFLLEPCPLPFIAEVIPLVEDSTGIGAAKVNAVGLGASGEIATSVEGAGCFGSLSCSS